MLKTYEIHLTSGEILSDGLSFDDLPILFQAYQEWYGEGSIIACCRTLNGKKFNPQSRQDEFYQDWYELIETLIALDNI